LCAHYLQQRVVRWPCRYLLFSKDCRSVFFFLKPLLLCQHQQRESCSCIISLSKTPGISVVDHFMIVLVLTIFFEHNSLLRAHTISVRFFQRGISRRFQNREREEHPHKSGITEPKDEFVGGVTNSNNNTEKKQRNQEHRAPTLLALLITSISDAARHPIIT
jgi:hypothetical protein